MHFAQKLWTGAAFGLKEAIWKKEKTIATPLDTL